MAPNKASVSPVKQVCDSNAKQVTQGTKVIGIQGTWYDVTDFIDKHPGGKLIEDYIGKDATMIFKIFHSGECLRDSMQYLKPVGKYKVKLDSLDNNVLKLQKSIRNKGDFHASILWLLQRFFIIFLFLYSSYMCVRMSLQMESYILSIIGACMLTGVWQQCGLLMHDCMHTSVFGKAQIDHFIGWIAGNIGIGVNCKWWKRQHDIHHSFTVTTHNGKNTDPQQKEIVWAQSTKLFNLDFYNQGKWQQLCILYQRWLFLPLCVLLGRFGIMVDGFMNETCLFQWIGLVAHWLWIYWFYLSQFDSWIGLIVFYFIAHCCQGILSLQLLVSHYDKPFIDKDVMQDNAWALRQAKVVKDIVNPQFMDWFHGGLNFHFLHHTMPRMSRMNARKYDSLLRKMLLDEKQFKIDRVYFWQAVKDVLLHLSNVAQKYGIWLAAKELNEAM